MLATLLLWFAAAGPLTEASATEHPTRASGQLHISYPLDGTLFPPDIAAPTLTWEDTTAGVKRWAVRFRFTDGDDLAFSATEMQWRPDEKDWAQIKRRSSDRGVDVTIAGIGGAGGTLSSAQTRISTSTDPVGDSIFYREVNLPFIEAVKDPSRIRWRFGGVSSHEQPPVVLEKLPVCGNCHSFSARR